jgi:hypothetical protein
VLLNQANTKSEITTKNVPSPLNQNPFFDFEKIHIQIQSNTKTTHPTNKK